MEDERIGLLDQIDLRLRGSATDRYIEGEKLGRPREVEGEVGGAEIDVIEKSESLCFRAIVKIGGRVALGDNGHSCRGRRNSDGRIRTGDPDFSGGEAIDDDAERIRNDGASRQPPPRIDL